MAEEVKRCQFGNRLLTDDKNVFEHNAWDNVEWTDEQEEEAKQKVLLQLEHSASSEDRDRFINDADKYWNDFYIQHQQKFYRDRNWLLTEFPELAPNYVAPVSVQRSDEAVTSGTFDNKTDNHSSPLLPTSARPPTSAMPLPSAMPLTSAMPLPSAMPPTSAMPVSSTDKCSAQSSTNDTKPTATHGFNIFEVGCGVGNTAFQVLKFNTDPELHVYCCDLSETAIQLVKDHEYYQDGRCEAFVCDITSDSAVLPIEPQSLDVIVLIFVISALPPEKVATTLERLVSLLKPGGTILFRDYGRYDLAQLRFKSKSCLSENFYVRGEGTLVYYFTQEELRKLFTDAGLVEVQNLVDRRLLVNRKKKQTLYRVWLQCKYRKPVE